MSVKISHGTVRLWVLCVLGLLGTGCLTETSRPRMPSSLYGRVIDVAGLPALETQGARVAIVEVTDYQCPFCRAHYLETFPLISEELVETGKVSYFVHNYPLSGNPTSGLAAIAASCANDQKLFWDYHHSLLRQSNSPGETVLPGTGQLPELDEEELRQCIGTRRAGPWLEQQRSLALGLGVRGTPTFFIGVLSGDRIVTDVTVLAGRQSIASFRRVVMDYHRSR